MIQDKTLFVGNLNYSTTDGDLYKFFNKVVEVRSVRLILTGGKSRGFAFVQVDDPSKAIQLLDEKELNGRRVLIRPEGT